MAAQFLRLKLRLLANTFRRSPWQVFGIVVALVYGLGIAMFAFVSLVALRFAPVPLATTVVVVGGSLIVLCFLLVPLAFGVDDTLDPRAFSLFGIPNSRLALGLALTALIGVPAIGIAIVSVAQVVTWSRSPLSVVIAVIGVPVIVATCTLGSRVSTSIASFLLATRRAREVSALIALLVIVSLSPLVAVLFTVDWAKNGLAIMASIARVAAWTPLGAVWSAPAEVAAGNPGAGIAKLAIALVFLVALAIGWRALVARMLVTPQRMSREKNYAGLGWFARTPATPVGAVAARSITYWLRDARYHTSLVAIPVAPLVFMIVLGVAGVPWNVLALIPVPAICLFLSWSVHNDIAYDNTAFWLHVASNTSGWADRIGRVVPALLIGIPVVVIGSPISAAFFGDFSVLPSIVGLSACILLAGLGLASTISAQFPYAAVRPGDSPFAQPQAAGSAAGLIQSLSFFATLVLALPVAALAGLGFVFGMWWTWGALALGLALGIAGLYFGVRLGAAIYSRRAPELLAFTLRN